MSAADGDVFGRPDQRALLQRGADMRALLADRVDCTYYGRTVGLTSNTDAPLDRLFRLARLQGNSSYGDLADAEIAPLVAEATAAGFQTVHYARWETDASALDACLAHAKEAALPAPYWLAWLQPDSPADLRAALAGTALSCGVLPPRLSVLTAEGQPGACALALTEDGQVASCAAAASYLHPDHPQGREVCWWGMLATVPDHRGHGLSMILGAFVMARMHTTFGFTRFFTGVEPGNAPSEAVCRKMGLAHRGRSILGIADPTLVVGGRMTK